MNTTKSSRIKDDSYYAEAESMQDGWGDTLRWVDVLKDKIQYNKNITLKEFCYSLYGDGHCSHCWDAFKMYCEQDLKYSRKRLLYDAWKGMFDKWVKTQYDRSKFYR